MIAGIVFTTWNGYIQGHYHALYADFDEAHDSELIHIIGNVFLQTTVNVLRLGFSIFLAGFYINIDSDRRLRNLRIGPNDTSYKIPRGI